MQLDEFSMDLVWPTVISHQVILQSLDLLADQSRTILWCECLDDENDWFPW